MTSQEHQTYNQPRLQAPQTLPNRITNIAPKPRSILPAPPNPPPPHPPPPLPNPPPASCNPPPQAFLSPPPNQQTFIMNQASQPQPQLKLPLPRLTSHQQVVHPSNNNSKRSRQQSKVISSVRPTQAILTQGEDGKCSYKVPIPRTPETIPAFSATMPPETPPAPTASNPTPNKSSITEALRAIDERIIEPPTVSVQRMIEENELLRKRMELDGYLTFSKSSANPAILTSPDQSTGTPDEEAKDLNSTNDSVESEKAEQTTKAKKKTTKRATSQSQSVSLPHPQQVVYQAIPAQALQSNQGYQLLIQMPPGGNLPNQTKVVPATQLMQGPGQQLVNNTAQVVNGQQIFLQKQGAPMQQMQIPAGSKAVYLVSQPSTVTSHAGQPMATSTVQSMGQYIVAPSQESSSEVKEEDSTPSSAASTPQHQDLIQQTPPPTLLSPANYDIQPQMQSQVQPQMQPQIQQQLQPQMQPQIPATLQPQQVLLQQQQPQQYHQLQFQQQPRYQNYFAGTQMVQPRFMGQQMYMQPSQIERVQQRPKLKPKPKTAPPKSKAKKTKTLTSDDDQISQMHANILAQQKQRQLTQQMHQQASAASDACNQRPQQSFPIQHPRYYSPAAIQQISPAPTPAPVANETNNFQNSNTQDIKPAPRQLYYQQGFQAPMFQQQGHYGQFLTPQQIHQTFTGTAGKTTNDKKASSASKRKSKKKTPEEPETRINIQIHSPIAFPMEKKPKKAAKKATDCPYSQQSTTVSTPSSVQQPVMSQMTCMQQQQQQQQQVQQQHVQQQQQYQQQQQHQQHLYQNMMHMYRQQVPQQAPPPHHQLPPSSHGYHLQPQVQYQPTPLLYKQYLQKPQASLQDQHHQQQQQQPRAAPQYNWNDYHVENYPSEQQGFQFVDTVVGHEEEDAHPQRTPSPHSDEEMDVNQFLNIPIKKETEETTLP